jgi:hypothetical protein
LTVAEGVTVEALVREYREDARATLQRFRQLYRGESEDFPPIALALRWSRALETDEPDIDAMADLVRECAARLSHAPALGIAFYGFCSEVPVKYRALWEAYLNAQE